MEQRVWISVVDARNMEDLRDLDHLSDVIWGANGNARTGDLILIYRTAPYSDIPYLFKARSDARLAEKKDYADTKYVIELGEKVRLHNPVSLRHLKNDAELRNWSFIRYRQGVLKHKKDIKEKGFWNLLRSYIVKNNKSLEEDILRLDSSIKVSQIHTKENTEPKWKKVNWQNRLNKLKHAEDPSKLQVFISYASEDREEVNRLLYSRLSTEKNIEVWMDIKELLPGDNWEDKIERIIKSVDAIIICASQIFYGKIGQIQKEIKLAIEVSDSQPENTTCILPVKLENCEVQERLSRWHFTELFKEEGYDFLMSGLKKRGKYFDIRV